MLVISSVRKEEEKLCEIFNCKQLIKGSTLDIIAIPSPLAAAINEGHINISCFFPFHLESAKIANDTKIMP